MTTTNDHLPVCGDNPCTDNPPHVTLGEDKIANPQDYEPEVYDPTTDPYRVDEVTVRRTIGIGVPLRNVGTIVMQGRFLPGGRGTYGAVAVLCEQGNGRGYCTHTAYVRSEADGLLTVSAEAGHYDQSREAAERDLAGR